MSDDPKTTAERLADFISHAEQQEELDDPSLAETINQRSVVIYMAFVCSEIDRLRTENFELQRRLARLEGEPN
jgi:hypothetical protein